jgi:hypothetical protein
LGQPEDSGTPCSDTSSLHARSLAGWSAQVRFNPKQVGDLKGQGMSWRQMAKALRIGTATAMRLFTSIDTARSNTREVRPTTSKKIE